MPKHVKPMQCGAPQTLEVGLETPAAIDISPINHGYWSCKPTELTDHRATLYEPTHGILCFLLLHQKPKNVKAMGTTLWQTFTACH